MNTTPEAGIEDTHFEKAIQTEWQEFCKLGGLHYTEEAQMMLQQIESYWNQQLQKARESWLREEIVKLEGMKVTPVHNSECLNNEVPEYCDCDNWIKRNQALQTIIDRYNSELDKDTNK